MYYAYLRISKKKRSKDDTIEKSIQEQTERQEMLVRDYCFNNDIVGSQVEFCRDIISGKIKNDDRGAYREMKSKLVKGDTVIVTEVSRLGRDLVDTKEEYYWYLKNGVNLIVLELPMLNVNHGVKDNVDMMYLKEQLIAMYTYMAQKTRENIAVNTSQALQAKIRKGAKLGRKAEFDHEAVVEYYLENDVTFQDVADAFDIKSKNTVANILKKYNVNTKTRQIEN